MSKRATPSHDIHPLLAERWSPYAFDPRPVSDADLAALFEAARWSASSYNEQPWHYLVARRTDPEAFERMVSCLVEGNRAWAREAPVLVLAVVARRFRRNGKPNRAAEHDLGAAAASLTFEATHRGLAVHQMIGIEPDRARDLFAIPEGLEAFTAIAIGHVAADPSGLPEALQGRDRAPRERKPLEAFVFAGAWGEPAALGGG